MNKYLEKVALTRLVKELAAGNVSATPGQLLSKGLIRSPKQYAAGMRKGNDVLSKRINAPVNKVTKSDSFMNTQLSMAGGAGTHLSAKGNVSVLIPTKSELADTAATLGRQAGHEKHLKSIGNQAMVRHELFEAGSIKKNLRTHGMSEDMKNDITSQLKTALGSGAYPAKFSRQADRVIENTGFSRPKGIIHSHEHGSITGLHHSLSVLGHESNMIRSNPYLRKGELNGLRGVSGESALISKITGKRFGSDKMTKKDLTKLDKAAPTLSTGYGLAHEV